MPVLETIKRVLRPSLSTREDPRIAENRLKICTADNPTIGSRVYSVVFMMCIRRFAHLKASVDGALCVGVFHPDTLEDQTDVIRHQTVSTAQNEHSWR